MKNIVGLDVGYGQLKCVAGTSEQPTNQWILPSVACPRRYLTRPDEDIGVRVRVDNEDWAAGVDHDQVERYVQPKNDEYSQTPVYEALVNAALLRTGVRDVDILVTGLPCSHFKQGDVRNSLSKRLSGSRVVGRDGKGDIVVNIKSTQVVPQPLGAYFELSWRNPAIADRAAQARVLVIDVGHYTVDWVVAYGRELRQASSSSSSHAVRSIFKQSASLVSERAGRTVSPGQIESAYIRQQRTVGYQQTPFIDLLEAAAAEEANLALAELKDSLQAEASTWHGAPVDLIVLAGGGAKLFEASVRRAYPKADVYQSQSKQGPAMANASGFYYIGWKMSR